MARPRKSGWVKWAVFAGLVALGAIFHQKIAGLLGKVPVVGDAFQKAKDQAENA